MSDTLGRQNLYHPDHRNKRLWVRMYKVASTSLLTYAFNHGWSPAFASRRALVMYFGGEPDLMAI